MTGYIDPSTLEEAVREIRHLRKLVASYEKKKPWLGNSWTLVPIPPTDYYVSQKYIAEQISKEMVPFYEAFMPPEDIQQLMDHNDARN